MNALIVYPLLPVNYRGYQYGLRFINKRASFPPLVLFTVAALRPNHWHVRLVDLYLEDLRDDDLQWADGMLTGGLLILVESMQKVIASARAFGVPVEVGVPAPASRELRPTRMPDAPRSHPQATRVRLDHSSELS